MKILSRANAKKKTKKVNDFEFRSFIGCFQVTGNGNETVNAHAMVLFFHIYMNASKRGLNQ